MHTGYLSSPLGTLRLQCTDSALTEIHFMDTAVESGDDHPLLRETMAQLTAYFDGRLQQFDLPILPEGTTFQKKVWELLVAIPFGKTLSYQTLSLQYGDVKAIRAVAAANGRNPLAILVPCHRVIGTNRSLTGYAGGLWRKQWLLQHEARFHSGVQELPF